MRISDWSSDVCSSDLPTLADIVQEAAQTSPCQESSHAQSDLGSRQRPPEGLSPTPRGGPACGRQAPRRRGRKIGRASCRERGSQYVKSSVVAVSLKKKTNNK